MLFESDKVMFEIYKETELKADDAEAPIKVSTGSMVAVVFQIMIVDMIFAIDSVLTAVGLTHQVLLIIIAMTIAILAMMFFSGPLADFIYKHPSLKILALAFLVMVGVLLVADAFGHEFDRTYVYVAILFALAVEALNFRRQRNLERQEAEEGPTGV